MPKVAGGLNPYAGQNSNPNKGSAGSTWAVPNTVIDPSITATNVVTCPLYQGVRYGKSVVFAKNALTAASVVPGTLGYDSVSSNLDGEINVRISRVADGWAGKEMYRIDVIFGSNAAYAQGICGLWTQLGDKTVSGIVDPVDP
jgi:hypothetical protein